MRNRYSLGLASLAMSLSLVACDSAENVSSASAEPGEAPVITPMNREITALKQREKDHAKIEAGLREIMQRYGYAVPEADQRNSAPAIDPMVGPVIEPEAKPLAKSSVIWVLSSFTSKSIDFGFNWGTRKMITVPAGVTVEAWTSGIGAADPALVAYYRASGSSTAYTVQVVGYNDDLGDGSQNAKIVWTNRTGSSRDVYFVLYAYSSVGGGSGNLYTRLGSGLPQVSSSSFRAYPLYLDEVDPRLISKCVGPKASRIQLIPHEVGGFGATALAIDLVNMRGGHIVESSSATQTLNLEDILYGGGGFLLGYTYKLNDFLNRKTSFTAQQQDTYSCPVNSPLF